MILLVRLPPRSLNTFNKHSTRRSVGVSAARRCGKAEGRVQFPDGPLELGGARLTGKHLVCTQVIGVQFSGAPLSGSSSNGKTPSWRGGNSGSTPGESGIILSVDLVVSATVEEVEPAPDTLVSLHLSCSAGSASLREPVSGKCHVATRPNEFRSSRLLSTKQRRASLLFRAGQAWRKISSARQDTVLPFFAILVVQTPLPFLD